MILNVLNNSYEKTMAIDDVKKQNVKTLSLGLY
jgi:hypothetical protein